MASGERCSGQDENLQTTALLTVQHGSAIVSCDI